MLPPTSVWSPAPKVPITERLRTVMRADEIVVLDRGTVVQRGRHEELITQPGLYRNIFDLEL